MLYMGLVFNLRSATLFEITHVQGLALVLSMSMEKTLFYTSKCECSSLGVGMAKLWKWVPSSVVELACRFCNISTNLYKKGEKGMSTNL